ncbi:MAG TPA: hypothetical protein VGM86_00040 [Thermoanaerobaculia bacterium]
MRGLGARLQDQGRRLWRWLFPPRVELPEEVARLVRALYPTLDLDAVRFHRGMPHLTRLTRSEAITIPAPFARRRTCVYVDPRYYDPGSVEGIGMLLHEAYHALQAQEAGWGLGPFRPFLALYFACGAANGFRYEGHPLEDDAYGLAGRRHSRFELAFAGGERPDPGAALLAGLATASSGVRSWPALARSLPLAPPRWLALPLLPLWLLLWAGAAAIVWLARLLVEGLGALAAGLLWGCGIFLSAIETFLYRHGRNL